MTVIVGEKYENFNTMCFEDPSDSTMRYAYAVEWDADKGDAIVDGRPTDSSVKGSAHRDLLTTSERNQRGKI